MIRVSWVNGEIVDVQDYDATGAKASQSVDMIASTISNKMDPNKKKQANNVIFVAKTEAQAEAVAERFKNDSRVRVIHSGSGFDSGRVFSSVTGGPNVQRMSPRMRGFHALGVVGSLMPLAQANSYFRSFGFWGGLREMGEDVIDPWGVLDTYGPPPRSSVCDPTTKYCA
ncbi:hypothetical protein [Streptomyces barkulensis]|nr:hypothetical protein [Streptomyces barkulensis]